MIKSTLIILLAILMQACSTTKLSEQAVQNDSFLLSATHCTPDQEKINNYRPLDQMILFFPSLPGIIFGVPSDDIIQFVTTAPKK
jgi:hypothetical protein